MGYNERYNIGWSSKCSSGYIYIDQLDSSSATESLILSKDSITINTNLNDWNDPVLSQTAQISIINNKANFFDLLPLLSAEEREYRIRINQTSPSAKKLFEGFLNTDIVEQTYLRKQPIRLVASSYVKKLENVYPKSLDSIQSKSLIDLLNESLDLTGVDSSIAVNNTLFPQSYSKTATNTLFNATTTNTELFWKNNVERDSALEVVKKILTPFDSYLYWYDGKWYVERYEDVYNYPQNYVIYSNDVSYGYYNNGTALQTTNTSTNIFSYKPLERSQMLSIMPGLNTIEIKLNHDIYGSFINNEFAPITYVNYPTVPYPERRKWQFMKNGTMPTYNTISYGGIQQGVIRYYYPSFPLYTDTSVNMGMYTRFKMTISPDTSTATVLNMSWKFIPEGLNDVTTTTSEYYIRWYLRYALSNNYCKYDITTNKWYKTADITQDVAIETLTVAGSELDKTTYLYEPNISIPLTDVSGGSTGDQEFIFGVMITKYKAPSSSLRALDFEYVGDFNLNISNVNQNNILTATVNNKFLNKKTIELDLYDTTDLNYKNGIYINDTRTSLWYDDASVYMKLTDRLIKNKFQLYNKSRQSISATIDCSSFLKPLSFWYDSNQPNKKFLLTGYAFYPTMNRYDATWNEYDDYTDVSLNNV